MDSFHWVPEIYESESTYDVSRLRIHICVIVCITLLDNSRPYRDVEERSLYLLSEK